MTISSTKKTFVTAISALLLSVLTLGSISPAQAALDGYTTSRAGTVVTVEVDCSLPYSSPGTFAYIEAYPGDTISFTSKLSGADECAYIYLSSGDMSIFDSAPVTGATTNAVFVSKSSVPVGTDSVWFPIYSATENGQHFVIRFVEDPTPKAPGTPGTPTATAGDAQATIEISAPTSGGAAETYTVTASPSGQTCTITVPDTSCTIAGLTNGYTYSFTSTATNAVGTSAPSASSNSVTPAALEAPGIPDAPTAQAGDASATVTVVAPSTGGPVDSYTVTANPGGATCVVTVPDASCEITGLTNGTAYTFTATATNASGSSEPSTASAAATPLAAPSAPGQPTRTLSGSSVNLSWTAPTNGTAPFTYTITASPAGPVCVVNGTTANCTGLVSGRAYTFTVTATNGAGSATSVASSSVTYKKPSTVTKKTLTGNKNFAGFAAGKSVLTLAMKKSIRAFVAANRSSSTFVCVGYVASAPKMSTDKALAQARAKAACDYIVKLKPSAKVSREGVVPKNATGANSRKVVLKAYKLTSN